MVKLRSRLIRSPFNSGSDASHSNNSGEPSSSSFDQQQSGVRRRNTNNQSESQGADQRRPFESLESASDIGSSSGANNNNNNNVTSTGKRKPESRGITASIRRAKTAMFRIATSPMKSSQHNNNNNTAAAAAVGNNNMDTSINDTSGGDQLAAVGAASTSSTYESPLAATRTINRTPSQEENVPPMALLSPNCGTSYYAHAAAAADDNNNIQQQSKKLRYSNESADTSSMEVDATKNVLEWMKDDAPPELLPKLLSFCGSRQMNALSRVNKAWNSVMKDESVWRVLCEDTHKWSNGDEVPTSWAQYYKHNPCVPIDYDSVEAAFESISSGPQHNTIENQVAHRYREQRKSARILLHPGPYFLRRPLVANVIGNVEIIIESIPDGKSSDPQHGMTWRQNYHKPKTIDGESSPTSSSSSQQLVLPGAYHSPRNSTNVDTRRPTSPILRQMFGCGRRSSSSAALNQSSSSAGSSSDLDDELNDSQSEHRAKFHQSCFEGPRPTALLCLESRRENEPIIRIRQGTVNLRGLKFIHYCEGTDIWNGNAAIQVQRGFGQQGRPLRVNPPSVQPTANISDCDVMSLSGRGIVIIDGGLSHIDNTNCHTSAATGVYVGGQGSMATMERSDVVDNGTGNTRNSTRGRGIPRGHSGVYVEQGLAKINDCNISSNSLTGISAVSTVQARLHIEDSDIRANRSDQMELPPIESGRCINRNNTISSDGGGRPRSKWLQASVLVESPRGRDEPPTPQSPLEDVM